MMLSPLSPLLQLRSGRTYIPTKLPGALTLHSPGTLTLLSPCVIKAIRPEQKNKHSILLIQTSFCGCKRNTKFLEWPEDTRSSNFSELLWAQHRPCSSTRSELQPQRSSSSYVYLPHTLAILLNTASSARIALFYLWLHPILSPPSTPQPRSLPQERGLLLLLLREKKKPTMI